MPIIKLDDVSYDLDKLSPDARAQVEMLLAAEQRIKELQRDLAITQTARNAYVQAAKALLQNEKGFSAG
jgi:hypothetical protein